MGFNTSVVILNDHLESLAKPEFGQRLQRAIQEQWGNGHLPTDFGYGTVIEQHHADETAIVAVGGNTGVKITSVSNFIRNAALVKMCDDDAAKLDALRQMAEELGYSITKKRKRS